MSIINPNSPVYVSYAWADDDDNQRANVIPVIQDAAKKYEFDLKLDRTHMHAGDSIEEFENAIGNSECVIIVFSKKYFQSHHCMYEFMRIVEKNEIKKIIPIQYNDISIKDKSALEELSHTWEATERPENIEDDYWKFRSTFQNNILKVTELKGIGNSLITKTQNLNDDKSKNDLVDVIGSSIQDYFQSIKDTECIKDLIKIEYQKRAESGKKITQFLPRTSNEKLIESDGDVIYYQCNPKIRLGGSCANLFRLLKEIRTIDLSYFVFDDVDNMAYMFAGCNKLKEIKWPDSINTKTVQDMSYMFADCASLQTLDLHEFDTSNVQDMSRMFSGCENVTEINISHFNFSNVKQSDKGEMIGLSKMFQKCSNLKDIDGLPIDIMLPENIFDDCNSLKRKDKYTFFKKEKTSQPLPPPQEPKPPVERPQTLHNPQKKDWVKWALFAIIAILLAFIFFKKDNKKDNNGIVSLSKQDYDNMVLKNASNESEIARLRSDTARLQSTIDKLLAEKQKDLANAAIDDIKAKADAGDIEQKKLLGALFFELKDYKNAIDIFTELYNTTKNLEYIEYVAEVYYKQGDYTNAIFWHRNAALKGFAPSQFNLGVCFENGKGVAENMDSAVFWYKKAALQGNCMAQYNLACCFGKDESIAENKDSAVFWCKIAAFHGLAEAQYTLGTCFEKGDGIAENIDSAVLWYRKAALQGNADAQVTIGFCYYNGKGIAKNKDSAVFWFKKAALQDNAEAQCCMAYCFAKGEGIVENKDSVLFWYRKSALQGFAYAQVNLGICFEDGEDIAASMDSAVFWYKKAALQGNSNAQLRLGICYYDGKGITKNIDSAVFWFRKAAEQEDAYAQCNLGNCFYYGYGIIENKDSAVFWFRKAAAQGDAYAQYNLGSCFYLGEGVIQNNDSGVFWYNQAAEQGFPLATQRLEEMDYAKINSPSSILLKIIIFLAIAIGLLFWFVTKKK